MNVHEEGHYDISITMEEIECKEKSIPSGLCMVDQEWVVIASRFSDVLLLQIDTKKLEGANAAPQVSKDIFSGASNFLTVSLLVLICRWWTGSL